MQNAPAFDALSSDWLQRHHVLPHKTLGESEVRVPVDAPPELLRALAFADIRNIVLRAIDDAEIDEYYASSDVNAHEVVADKATSDSAGIPTDSSPSPVIRLIQRVLAKAFRYRASDIHIEPMAHAIVLRFRIDGQLREIERWSPELSDRIANRIKVMAELDISESRLPQDGRLRACVEGENLDVRVSTSPTAHGESIVLRLLGQNQLPLQLNAIGLPDDVIQDLLATLDLPHGIILLTGPTGSGKTSTLYAALAHLRRPEVKILTVEDPVEILLDGINQVQVRPEIELDYARTLRAFLRQDPDILMIGEIRDRDTADIALRAALTGHLVLSTLHTNSALGAFTRLADLGIENYLAASTIQATIAQRLVRTLCEDCKQPRVFGEPDHAHFSATGVAPPETVFEPVGCDACSQLGYRGRAPLVEFVGMTPELAALVREGRSAELALDPARTLFGRGLALVALGRTSLTEVKRVAGAP